MQENYIVHYYVLRFTLAHAITFYIFSEATWVVVWFYQTCFCKAVHITLSNPLSAWQHFYICLFGLFTHWWVSFISSLSGHFTHIHTKLATEISQRLFYHPHVPVRIPSGLKRLLRQREVTMLHRAEKTLSTPGVSQFEQKGFMHRNILWCSFNI